ncbi:MAG: glycosyltransferase family 2 protein [Jatrophihabitans sp.]|uniref:glycosyltransferase family 2 protein n=1 Tax=Jatrophihabitans sp. TaxID=1932789 RepID=UPI003F7DBC75
MADEAGRPLPSVGVVVLSQGTRMPELRRCLDGLLAQQGVELDVLVVGNGWAPSGLPDGVRTLALPENLGIPEGRNVGAAAVRGEIVGFVDDDAWLDDPDLLAAVAGRFGRDATLGSVQPHVCDEHGVTMRRWVPRLRVDHPERPGPGFTIAECVMFVRRSAFDGVGGWPGHFWYGHEGIDLAWRLWDGGWTVHYAGDLTAHHPATLPSRHAVYYRHNARNRVWVARRNLPAPVLVLYLLSWIAITALRLGRRPRAWWVWWQGFAEGFRTDPGPRRPMRWTTVWRLARLGHPPIV